MNSEEITTDANNLYNSSLKVRKSSPNKVTTMRFMQNQITDIGRAQEELHDRIWKIEQMKPFIISERGHIRKIQGNTPYDRMIIHSYIDYCLEPLLSKYMIYDNYASQKGKGTELARHRFREYLSNAYREYGNNKFYVLLIDFRKFYDNVQHQLLFDEIMRKIPYEPFHEYMLWNILDSFKVDVSWMSDEEYANCMNTVYVALDHIADKPQGKRYMAKSINIGNQASQLFSIFYPTRIDNYCKIVKGIKRYGRYMDDIFIIHSDKQFIWRTLDGIRPICDDLGLFLNEKKTQLYRVDNDFKFLNRIYKVTPSGHIIERLAPNTIYREQYKLKKLAEIGKPIDEQFNSWIGSFRHDMTKWEIDKIYSIKEMAKCKMQKY